jgi:hypothetical protein
MMLVIATLGATAARAKPGHHREREPFFVSTIFTSTDDSPSVLANARGDTVIVWASLDEPSAGIWGRRFAPNGKPLGAQFQVGPPGSGLPRYEAPVGAMDAKGNFVVAWLSEGFGLYPTEVLAQRFDALGVPQGSVFTVTGSSTRISAPTIAMSPGGDFVIGWTPYDVPESPSGFVQRYNASGTPQGTPIRVNPADGSSLFAAPALAMNGAGDFTAAWVRVQDGAGGPVVSRTFSARRGTLSDERVLATPDTGLINGVHIAMNSRGTLLVGFNRFNNAGPAGSQSLGIFARLFEERGRPISRELRVSTDDAVQFRGELGAAMNERGDFVLTWIANESPDGGETKLNTRAFDRSGSPLTRPRAFAFPELGTGPRQSSVAIDSRGNYTVAWQMNTVNPDDSGQGPNILGMRFCRE